MRKNSLKLVVLLGLASISSISSAHISTGTAEGGSFVTGFTHPLLGLDHLLAMLAVGLWAGQSQSKILWMAPLSFMLFMVIGGVLGIMHFNLPMTEHAIIMSLIVFGSLIALSVKANVYIAMLILGAFAIFHGHAHGTEMSITASASQYTVGFIAATGILHLIGIAIAKIFLFKNKMFLSRLSGGGIITAAIILLI